MVGLPHLQNKFYPLLFELKYYSLVHLVLRSSNYLSVYHKYRLWKKPDNYYPDRLCLLQKKLYSPLKRLPIHALGSLKCLTDHELVTASYISTLVNITGKSHQFPSQPPAKNILLPDVTTAKSWRATLSSAIDQLLVFIS